MHSPQRLHEVATELNARPRKTLGAQITKRQNRGDQRDRLLRVRGRLSRVNRHERCRPAHAEALTATHMLAAGVPLHTVSELLGHSSVAVTGDVYGHVSTDGARSAVQRLSAAMSW
jgi:integrase